MERQVTCPDCTEDFAASLGACPMCGCPVVVPGIFQEPVSVTPPIPAAIEIRNEPSVLKTESTGVPQTGFWTLYTSLEGRIGRETYWTRFIGPMAVIGFIAGIIDGSLGTEVGTVSAIAIVISIWPSTVGNVKRLHDRGLTGWHIAVFWGLMLIMILVMGVLFQGSDDLGGGVGVVMGIVWAGYALYLVVVCGFLKGTEGLNKYGPDPLRSSTD